MAKAEQPPPYTVDGTYEDEEWRALAADKNRSPKKEKRYLEGPRRHPYGPNVYTYVHKNPDGTTEKRYFSTEKDFQLWSNAQKSKGGPSAEPAASEGDVKLTAAAEAKARAADPALQAKRS